MNNFDNRKRAPRNRTITLSKDEEKKYAGRLINLHTLTNQYMLENKTINQDIFEAIEFLPDRFVDLLFIDPPYNITKDFGTASFKEISSDEYAKWFNSWFSKLIRVLKSTSSVYICGDWRSSGVIQSIAEKYLIT